MNARILVVDDDKDLAEGLAEVFELEGMSVTIAMSLSEALLLAEAQWDIAVVDGNLIKGIVTGDDGREVTSKIAELHPETKIIGFSGGNYQPQSFWKQHGAFVAKPASPFDLLAAIEHLT